MTDLDQRTHEHARTPGDQLAGKVAFVTGGASGIGRAIVQRFVQAGADVVAADVDRDGLDGLAERLDAGDRVETVHCDVTDEASVAAAVDTCVDRFGALDIAVANAGRGAFAPVVGHPLDEWRSIIDLCLTGAMLTLNHAGRVMRDGGSMIVISSLNATQPARGMSAYCAAKAGVVALTRCAAMELGDRGIRVNAIAPGLIETAATSLMFSLPGLVDEFVDNAPIGRFGTPEDVAGVALFLAGDDSTFVTGSLYAVDGGGNTGRYPDLAGAVARLAAPID
jgi:NAD(P)-dependent dehydrogenase (short-subunit alcohol dehydrogenase family)